LLRSTLLWLSERDTIFELVRRNGFSRKFASRFVAGETLDEAIDAARALNEKGISTSLDLLGESVTDEQEAARSRDEVVEILDRIAETGVDANVSVKLTQMGLDLSDEICVANMFKVLERARTHDIFVRVDMEGSPYTEQTLKLFTERLQPEFGDLTGVVIQSYMRRSAADVDMLIDKQARVRLCKGAYAEPAAIAFQGRKEVADSYASLMQQLVQRGNYPGIATHDEDLVQRTVDFVKKENISPDRFEFQMLYGVRRDLQNELHRHGYNMRVYIPFGTQWYPYLMRRLAERPANVAFITMSVVKEAFSRK
jgi:proline dehydrogenase